MGSATTETWLVTGANSGLGLAITVAALQANRRVIATARNVQQAKVTAPEVERLGGQWLQLDVTAADTEKTVADAIERSGGRLDVVVNNAGYMVLTPLEECSIEEASRMLDTHVLGAIRVLKGVLPTLRAQKSGTIINMSSFSGMVGVPAAGLYNMCKFALEGLSETYQAELSSFNIRVIILEPGAFKTEVLRKARGEDLSKFGLHYLNSAVGHTLELTRGLAEDDSSVAGDPAKLGQRVIEIVSGEGFAKGTHDVLRFPMGRDSVSLIEGKVKKLVQDIELTKPLACSTDFDGHAGSVTSDLLKA